MGGKGILVILTGEAPIDYKKITIRDRTIQTINKYVLLKKCNHGRQIQVLRDQSQNIVWGLGIFIQNIMS